LLLLAGRLSLTAAEHPVPLEKDADCATCHEEKTKGKAVHSAIALGCTTCHDVKTTGQTTTVNLASPKEEICFTCHEKSSDATRHVPYEKGQCVTCHDPHTSDFPKQLRAQTTTLCLACHGYEQSGVKTDSETKKVTLPWNQIIPLEEYGRAPKLGLDHGGRSGHPIMGHPLDALDPRDKDKKTHMSCVSCHVPHSSTMAKLLPGDLKVDIELCSKCHQ
jgi:predicted CXXCH cytochrome family protein